MNDVSTTDGFIEAIKTAQSRGMIPIVIVIPATPEFLKRTASSGAMGHAADKAARRVVSRWRKDNGYE